MLLSYMCLGIYFNLTIWFKLSNQTKYGLMIAAVGAIITVAGNWLLIPVWGYYASAWTHLVCYIVMIYITWRLGKRYYPIPYPLKQIALYIIFALSLYVIAFLTKMDNLTMNIMKNSIIFSIFVFYVNRKEKMLKKLF